MSTDVQDTVYGPAASDLADSRLADLCVPEAGVQTGPFGSQLHQEDYVPVGTPIITVEHLGENRILHEGVPRVAESDRSRLAKYALRPGDIVFSRVGSVDRRALVRDSEAGWLFSGRCLRVRPDPRKVDPGFLSYFFGLPAFKEHIRAIAVGATMPSLNTSLLSDVRILHPQSVDEQHRLAQVLFSLDDKIELNRQMSETVESMARALFKSWFVDFEPVRAKFNGRATGLAREVADLFPDSLSGSEIGEIPRGWEPVQIDTLAEVVGGTTPSTSIPAYWDGGTHHWATPKDLAALSFPVLLETERQVTDEGLAAIGSGLLPPGTVLLSSRAPIGYLAVTELPVAINQGFIAMVPRAGVSNLFLLHWARAAQAEILSRANGSTFLEISKSSFRPILVAAPQRDLMTEFEKVVRPLYSRLLACIRESALLARIRDALLPRLISGEVRVR